MPAAAVRPGGGRKKFFFSFPSGRKGTFEIGPEKAARRRRPRSEAASGDPSAVLGPALGRIGRQRQRRPVEPLAPAPGAACRRRFARGSARQRRGAERPTPSSACRRKKETVVRRGKPSTPARLGGETAAPAPDRSRPAGVLYPSLGAFFFSYHSDRAHDSRHVGNKQKKNIHTRYGHIIFPKRNHMRRTPLRRSIKGSTTERFFGHMAAQNISLGRLPRTALRPFYCHDFVASPTKNITRERASSPPTFPSTGGLRAPSDPMIREIISNGFSDVLRPRSTRWDS